MEEKNHIQIPRVKLGSQGLEVGNIVNQKVFTSSWSQSWSISDYDQLKGLGDSSKVSKLGFGCAGLSGIYNAPLSHEEGCSIIKEVFNRGITFFDTAEIYGETDNEIMLGKALKDLPREKVQLATKFGIVIQQDGQVIIKGTPEYVRKCCEASLQRLGVDYIDLYYPHRVDMSVPIEDTMMELKKLVEEGKVKYIGLSEASPDTIRRAHSVHPISAIQMEYSLLTREIEHEIIPLCRELGIGIVAYSPLGRGFFGGKAIVENLHSESILVSVDWEVRCHPNERILTSATDFTMWLIKMNKFFEEMNHNVVDYNVIDCCCRVQFHGFLERT